MGGWRAAEGGREQRAQGDGWESLRFKEGEEKMESQLEEEDGRDEFANRGREKKNGGGGHGGMQTSANTQLTS